MELFSVASPEAVAPFEEAHRVNGRLVENLFLSEEAATPLYRIALEAASNAQKHAEASEAVGEEAFDRCGTGPISWAQSSLSI